MLTTFNFPGVIFENYTAFFNQLYRKGVFCVWVQIYFGFPIFWFTRSNLASSEVSWLCSYSVAYEILSHKNSFYYVRYYLSGLSKRGTDVECSLCPLVVFYALKEAWTHRLDGVYAKDRILLLTEVIQSNHGILQILSLCPSNSMESSSVVLSMCFSFSYNIAKVEIVKVVTGLLLWSKGGHQKSHNIASVSTSVLTLRKFLIFKPLFVQQQHKHWIRDKRKGIC